MFSVCRERLGPVEGPQLGLEQGPVRKTPPLLIETTQFSLSDLLLSFFFKSRGEGFRQTSNVSRYNAAVTSGTLWLHHNVAYISQKYAL